MDRAPSQPVDGSRNSDNPHSSQESSPHNKKRMARSCLNCHSRKVRCDRRIPCVNCSKHRIPCVYPSKDHRQTQKTPTLQDITNSLERLERLILSIVKSGENEGQSQTQVQANSGVESNETGTANLSGSYRRPGNSTWDLLWNKERVVGQVADNSGVVSSHQDARSTPSYPWRNMRTSPTPVAQLDTNRLVISADVLQLYPDTQLALRLWNVYVTSVDPVVKILHIPTVQSTVLATILDPSSASSSTLVLTLAIYYAAVTALSHDNSHESSTLQPADISVLLKQYRMCLDRLLTVVELTSRPEIMSLQALAIYATCLRANELGRSAWVLNGLAIRLAQSIGLYREDASLRMKPFETEMRLRLWWHLCVLDSRAPEDQGVQPAVDIRNIGMRLPLNLNDNQIYPDMTQLPVASTGWTEMSFFLIQAESCRRVRPIVDAQGMGSANPLLDIEDGRNHIRDLDDRLQEMFGISPRSGGLTGLPRIAMQHISMACKKVLFVLQLQEQLIMQKKNRTHDKGTSEALKQTFALACDALESSHVLLNDLASKFNWFFSMYTQWYALTYVMRCLCSSSNHGRLETERAWFLVEELFPHELNFQASSVGDQGEYNHGSIWRYVGMLRDQALSVRKRAGLPVGTAAVGAQPPSNIQFDGWQLPDAINTAFPASGSTATGYETTSLPGFGQQPKGSSSQDPFSFSDLSMPGAMLLTDWDAVINGYIYDNESFRRDFDMVQ
ncbi:hypothetical protein N7478_000898 [Penicillium angulare]|uniref:uncharacterized protein n=1 Tax=Penicillium angulare TaxID=116970 RepID=UPI00253FCFAB|nr:uncharacterized protein N7478_000898 [Penicillium angulare]KAJ5291647.1 hypothetical protein N7478_000898 [Penicillium angulare]